METGQDAEQIDTPCGMIDWTLGRLQPIVNGMIQNDTLAVEDLQPTWSEVARCACVLWQEACQEAGVELHALYLRGSVARGLAVPGSDVDTVGIVLGVSDSLNRLLKRRAGSLAEQFDEVSKIETQVNGCPFEHLSCLVPYA